MSNERLRVKYVHLRRQEGGWPAVHASDVETIGEHSDTAEHPARAAVDGYMLVARRAAVVDAVDAAPVPLSRQGRFEAGELEGSRIGPESDRRAMFYFTF